MEGWLRLADPNSEWIRITSICHTTAQQFTDYLRIEG